MDFQFNCVVFHCGFYGFAHVVCVFVPGQGHEATAGADRTTEYRGASVRGPHSPGLYRTHAVQ